MLMACSSAWAAPGVLTGLPPYDPELGEGVGLAVPIPGGPVDA